MENGERGETTKQDTNNDENGDADLTGNIKTNDVTRKSPKLQKCTISTCKSAVNEYMLKCEKCSRLTHYSCTRLPNYQLYLFTREKYRLYMCDTCVGVIPSEIS